MSTYHVYPTDEQNQHNTDGGECFCNPTKEFVPADDGSNGNVITHNSVKS